MERGTTKIPTTGKSISALDPIHSTEANKKGDLAEDNEIFLDYAEHGGSKALDAKKNSQMMSSQAKTASFHHHRTMGYYKSTTKGASGASMGDLNEEKSNALSKTTTNPAATDNDMHFRRNTLKAEAVKANKEDEGNKNITIRRNKFSSNAPSINNNNTKHDSKHVSASEDSTEEQNLSGGEESHNSGVTNLSSSSIKVSSNDFVLNSEIF